jgi:hypothetical protein
MLDIGVSVSWNTESGNPRKTTEERFLEHQIFRAFRDSVLNFSDEALVIGRAAGIYFGQRRFQRKVTRRRPVVWTARTG